MVLNEESSMFKKGMVQTMGIKDYTGWQMLADEGAAEGAYPFGPSPLSYYTTGLASNLHTQILKAAEVLNVELDNVKVEVSNTFRWDAMSSIDGAGFLDVSTTNIIIDSDIDEKIIQEITEMALNSWAPGNALINKTSVEPHLIINGDSFEKYNATPGTSKSEVSYDGEFLLTSVADVPTKPQYLKLKEEMDMGILGILNNMDNLEFEIFAIAESAGNDNRPYLTKVSLSTPSDETWEIYADEFMGEDDRPLAPTSLEYFTLGTSLCLTSQTTLVSAMMDLDYTDYRVEHLFEYNQENVNIAEMLGSIDTIHTYVVIESDESQERLEEFNSKALALCFAGEGLVNETEMVINTYINKEKIK